MKTISQVAELAGISIRTLQYYDKIGLLKPSELTSSKYRLYNDDALQNLQQILFFKELGFKLKDIKEILQKPEFDKISAFKQQRELLLLKRNRTDRLIQLLSRLEKGEQCMSFKEFDLSDYIEALEHFKRNNTDDVIKNWGSIENFELFIQKVKDDESQVAKLAIKQYGSIETYTEAMKYNLEHFSVIMEQQQSGEVKELLQKSNDLYAKLTSNRKNDVSSRETQNIVQEIVRFTEEHMLTSKVDENFWTMIINTYSSDYVRAITDTKHGAGASDYIAGALQYYFSNTAH